MGLLCPGYHVIVSRFHQWVKNKHNKSTQRVYNTFEKRSNTISLQPPPPPPSISFSPPPLFLANFHSFSLGKRKEFCLVLSHLAFESTPVQFTTYPLCHHISPSPLIHSVRFLCAIRIWREFLTANVRRAFHVKVATNVTTIDDNLDFTVPALPVIHAHFFISFISPTFTSPFLPFPLCCSNKVWISARGGREDNPFKSSLLLSLLFLSSCPFICLSLFHLWLISSHTFPPLSVPSQYFWKRL